MDIPLIFLTAHSEEPTVRKAIVTDPYGYILKPFDATELKFTIELTLSKHKMEKKLKESEKKFILLFKNSPLPYQSLDENGNFLEVNPAWLKCLGYSRDEVIEKNFIEFLTPRYREAFINNFPRFKEAGEAHGVELGMKHKDGSCIYVSYESKIGYDEMGNFNQTHCIFQDITESKNSENMHLKNEFLENIIENIPNMIFIKSADKLNFEMVNKAGEELLGHSREELIGKNDYDFSPRMKQIFSHKRIGKSSKTRN